MTGKKKIFTGLNLCGFDVAAIFTGCDLAGAGVLAVGIWTLIDKSHYVAVLTTSTYEVTTYLLLLTGICVMIVGALGCCGAVQEQKLCLILYTSLLLIVLVMEVVAGILAYVYHNQLEAELQDNLNNTLTSYYGMDGYEDITIAVDDMQRNFNCCGSSWYLDWPHSNWAVQGLAINRSTPDSCCKTESNFCAVRDHPSNIEHIGCIKSLEMYFKDHLVILGGVGIGIACLQ
ncbi:CD151 antigen-like, partial [Saccoglossus kowalevskii]|uniref:Tetraspanin n=1 Tax=Saccoglossus kowalevskii TaxID=10224 RepID=A0ABM0LXZ2_SACKO